MKTATLAQCANFVWEGVVEVVEKHFIPTVASSQNNCHDQSNASTNGAVSFTCKNLIPPMRMCEVRDHEPCCTIAAACTACHGNYEPCAFSCCKLSKLIHTEPKG